MKDCAKNYLEARGYKVNTTAIEIIMECGNWYANRVVKDFHKTKNLNGKEIELKRMNFAKRCCADDANLCEIISVAPVQQKESEDFIRDFLQRNRFDVMYREQLERTSAEGTVGAYIMLSGAEYLQDDAGSISVRGGEIRICYVTGDCIIPLTVENGSVEECAFCATNLKGGKEQTVLVIFTRTEGRYTAETVIFNEKGQKDTDGSSVLQLGDVKPFAIMRNAEVNNIDGMTGYGLPKIYNSIPVFMAADLCYNLLYGDLAKGDKLVFLNELLACIQIDEEGKPFLTPQQKDIFILLGRGGATKLPEENSLVKEYNPEIRVDEITKAFELVLSLMSMSFGYGTKKYSFENGRITTATEYIGTKQDAMQELNKQRKQATDYITDIVHAAMWFSNAFHDTAFDASEELSIEFDDSYITDKETELQRVRDDACTFDIPQMTIWYLMKAYNLSEEEAAELVVKNQETQEQEVDDDMPD